MQVRRTAFDALDRAVHQLQAQKDIWAHLPIPERIALLHVCAARYLETAADVVAAGCAAKGVDPGSFLAGEEWLAGPVQVLRTMRLVAQSLSRLDEGGSTLLPAHAVRRTPTGELAVQVFPADALERFMYAGTSVDVWMQPGVDEDHVRDETAAAYRAVRREGRVALVLGAGNVASIAPMDVLYKMLVENRVVLLKLHPVNDYLGPLLERAFEPLISPGYLHIVYGGAAEGAHVAHHDGVDEVHLTGSAAVHDRIVWGETSEEQALRRAANTPKLTRRITSELGCVTPAIVLPGAWTGAELDYQAANVATMVAHSASCTCTSARVVVTWRRWPQRLSFLDRITAALARYPPRQAYYPGAAAKYAAFLRAHSQSRVLAPAPPGCLAPASIQGVDPSSAGDLVFEEEAWSPVLVEAPLDAPDEGAFLDAAVRFCNERLAGTLSACVIAPPDTRARLGAEFDRAVSALRYGTVAINHWTAVSFGLAVAPWGAYPGHTLEAIGSGIGVVHNTLMFDRPLKTVLWGPFTARPTPPWFVTHHRSHIVGRRMAAFEASPDPWRLPGIVSAALRP